ncbi:MAG TPA: hypothetical protein EYN96_03625 [Candidatus Hydrogenedentes bacterium]|nr:hypothetical protein [Candidatus Hydrogenedentota bacterium]
MIDAEFCEYFGESACSGRYMGELVFSGGIEFESSETFEVFDVFWGRVDGHLSEPQVEGEWLTRQYAKAESKPIRFFIESGMNEGGSPSMVTTNRHFRDVLLAKGNEIVKYDEFNGGHHYLNWRGSLADGLIALIGK